MGAPAAQQATASLKEYVSRYIAKRTTEGASEQTLRIYRFWLTHPVTEKNGRSHPGGIAAHVGTVDELDSLAVQRYFTLLKDRGLKPSTRHQAYRTVKAWTRWLQKRTVHGPLPHGDPMEDVQVKVPRELPRLAKVEDIQAVINACDRSGAGLRNRAAVLAMADSLMRRAEIVHLLVSDYRPGDRRTGPTFHVRLGKGGKDRIISCGAETHDALTAYLDARENYTPAGPLFAAESGESLTTRGLARVLHRLSDRADLPRERWLAPHQLRHWGATNWHRAGVPLATIQQQLGHSSVTTTMRYLHLDVSDLQREHMEHSPLARAGVRIKR